jgi:hypothetical protein
LTSLREQRSHAPDHFVGLAFEAARGDADRVDSGQLQILDADGIALEGSAGSVRRVPVQFDGEALPLPIGVDLMAGDERVDGGLGRPARFTRSKKSRSVRARDMIGLRYMPIARCSRLRPA